MGSHATPPLAPPNGIPISAHFQVIHIDSARTSSSTTSGWYRMPPFDGPRAMLWVTRIPLEDLDVAVVHRHGDGDGHRLLALREDVDDVLVDGERAGDVPELRLRDLVGVLAKMRDRFLDRHVHTPWLECPFAVAESMTDA